MTHAQTDIILWNASYATGIDEIDEQHQILVSTLNEANLRLREDESLEALEQITRDLLAYALYHFETEEGLMREFGYAETDPDNAEAHLAQHRAFSSKVVEVRDRIKSGNRIPREELISFLNQWLVNHILATDRKLGEFILARKNGANRAA